MPQLPVVLASLILGNEHALVVEAATNTRGLHSCRDYGVDQPGHVPGDIYSMGPNKRWPWQVCLPNFYFNRNIDTRAGNRGDPER